MQNSSVPLRFLYRILIEPYCEELHKRLKGSKWIDPLNLIQAILVKENNEK